MTFLLFVMQFTGAVLGGAALGQIWGFRRYTQRWNAERLRDLEDDVAFMYVTHGMQPPAVARARRHLGLDETPMDDR